MEQCELRIEKLPAIDYVANSSAVNDGICLNFRGGQLHGIVDLLHLSFLYLSPCDFQFPDETSVTVINVFHSIYMYVFMCV